MKRLAFNGGEISPSMTLRSDMDAYHRSCSQLINFDLAQTGGISRRRGMRPLLASPLEYSILIPYTYDETQIYLIELSSDTLIIRSNSDASELQRIDSDGSWQFGTLERVRWLQINALLLLFSDVCPVMALRLQRDGSWTFAPFEFKNQPWYTIDVQDHPLTISSTTEGHYLVSFDEQVISDDSDPESGERLRVSYYTQQAEAFTRSIELRRDIEIISSITPSSSYDTGHKLALHGDISSEYFVCTADFSATNDFVAGLISPANYPDNFLPAENLDGFDTIAPIYEMTNGKSYKKGDKIALQSGYWDLYTCIKPFTPADYIAGYNEPTHYPSHFVRGVPIGDALPCGGTWQFYCSGSWFGSYDIRRSYDGPELTGEWEDMGESFSRIGSSSNENITGDESQEECHLRLFITRSKYLGDNNLAGGWPADSCSNRLIIPSYRHDMILRCQMLDDDDPSTTVYHDESHVPIPITGSISSRDWSWQAFGVRYGYPTSATLHESRLIMASTRVQPQTLWLSRVDDLNNFATGDDDSAGMHLTMSTSTQSPICWIYSRGHDILLGTEDGEWLITASNSATLTPSTARIDNQGRTGSAHQPAVLASDRVIYIERGEGRVYQYGYNYDSNSYQSTDLTIYADHITSTGGGILSGTIIRKPYTKLIYLLRDGTLALMTYNAMHNINGWHRYQTAGHIESICALPAGNADDQLYLITQRDGTRWIELIDSESPYSDSDSLDYTSTMETTAFSAMDRNDGKAPSAGMQFYFATPTPADSITVTIDADRYASIDRAGTLPTGWNDLIAFSTWRHMPMVGIRVTGDTPCTILALQV